MKNGLLANKVRFLLSTGNSDEKVAKELARIYKENRYIFLQEIGRDASKKDERLILYYPIFLLALSNYPKSAKVFLDILLNSKKLKYSDTKIENDKFSIFNEIINQSDSFGNTCLHYAISHKYHEITGDLIRHGANLNAKKFIEIDDNPLQHAVRNENIPAIRMLLKAGCDVNSQNKKFKSVLHLAVEQDSFLIVGILLANGAKISLQNNFGDTPLHLALRNINPQDFEAKTESSSNIYETKVKIIKLLLSKDYGINPNKKGEICLDLVRKKGIVEIIRFIESKHRPSKEKIEKINDIPKKSAEILPAKERFFISK